MNKFEQVSSDDHQMPVGGRSHVSYLGGRGRSHFCFLGRWGSGVMKRGSGRRYPCPNASWVNFTYGPPLNRMTDRRMSKHYLPATSFADGNYMLTIIIFFVFVTSHILRNNCYSVGTQQCLRTLNRKIHTQFLRCGQD